MSWTVTVSRRQASLRCHQAGVDPDARLTLQMAPAKAHRCSVRQPSILGVQRNRSTQRAHPQGRLVGQITQQHPAFALVVSKRQTLRSKTFDAAVECQTWTRSCWPSAARAAARQLAASGLAATRSRTGRMTTTMRTAMTIAKSRRSGRLRPRAVAAPKRCALHHAHAASLRRCHCAQSGAAAPAFASRHTAG